jgi:hypothetical protein
MVLAESETIPELPTLEPGLTLLETEAATRAALHPLVLDHVLRDGQPAYWIDTHDHARTRPLASLAPDPRVLDRIHVARGFTAVQHYALVETLAERVEQIQPSLLVVPALDGRYREEEGRRNEGTEMLVRALATLAGVARRQTLPVLLTRTAADDFAAPVERATTETIRCERTGMGPRFSADGFETLVYAAGHGTVQTTLAFWKEVLAAREPVHEWDATPTPEVIASGAN